MNFCSQQLSGGLKKFGAYEPKCCLSRAKVSV